MDMEIEVEHQMEDDVEAEEEMGDDDEEQQQAEPEPKHVDDYLGGPHDTTMLTRYHVHMAMMAADGEVRHEGEKNTRRGG